MNLPTVRFAMVLMLLFALAVGDSPGQSGAPWNLGWPSALSTAWAAEDDEPPAPLELDDPVEPRKSERTPQEQDRLQALKLFGAARRKEEDDEVEAVRMYQRAHRLDPQALPVLERMVPLLFKLKREEEGVRYAIRAVRLGADNLLLVQQLALHLTQQGEIDDALPLYDRLLAEEPDDQKKTARHVVLVMEYGRLSFLKEKYPQAAESFKQVLHALENARDYGLNNQARGLLLGDASKTYAMFGEAFLQAGDYPAAAESFESAYRVDRDRSAFTLRQARTLSAEKKFEEALAKLDEHLADPSPALGLDPYELLGEVLAGLGKSEQQLERLQSLYKEQPKNGALALFLARQAEGLPKEKLAAEPADDEEEAAENESVKSTRPAPDNSPEARQRAAAAHPLYKAAVENLEDTAESISLKNAATAGYLRTSRHMQDAEAVLNALTEVAVRDDDLQAVGSSLEEIAADGPFAQQVLDLARQRLQAGDLEFGGRLAAALLALEAEQYEAVDRFFAAAVEAREEAAAQVTMTWALGLLLGDKHAEAVRVLRRGIADNLLPEGNPAFHYYLATALAMGGQTNEAVAAAREAAEMVELNPRIESRLPWVYYQARKYDQAEREYLRLLEKYDELQNSEVRRVMRETRLILSNLEVERQRLDEAEEWLEQVLDEFPDDPGAHNDLGYLWADRNKNLHRAKPMIAKALEHSPNSAAYLDSMGWVEFRLGNHADAIRYLERAVEQQGDDADGVVLDHLGDAYLAAGLKDKAAATWRRAIESFESDQERNAAKIEKVKAKLAEKAND